MRGKILRIYDKLVYHKLQRARFDPLDSDCFVCSWPRSGNTWLRMVLYYSLHPDDTQEVPQLEEWMPMIGPHFDQGVLGEMRYQNPRMFKTHDPFSPYTLDGRVVYIIRDGRDATTSLYNYRKQLGHVDLPFSVFLKNTLKGKYYHGSWHQHVQSWWQQRDHPAVLIVRYEDMLKDAVQIVRQVLDHFRIDVPDEQIRNAVERSSLQHVTKLFQKATSHRSSQFKKSMGGHKGSWKDIYSSKDIERFKSYAQSTMQMVGYDMD